MGLGVSRSYVGLVFLALSVSTGVATAACTAPVGNSITCTGGPGASVSVTAGAFTAPHTVTGSPYPSGLAVSGAPAGSTVSTVSLTLNGYTAAEPLDTPSGDNSADVGILFESPGGIKNLQIMRCAGNGSSGSSQKNETITIVDAATMIPACAGGNRGGWTSSGSYAPSVYDDTDRDGEASPDYGITIQQSAATLGTSTLTQAFAGQPVNGTWNLYLADDGVAFGASISFSSWNITITYTAASTPSTTSLSPNPSTAFTTSPNNSVTLTATVTAGATGTVTFKEGNTNLTCSGGNPATISGSTATCVTTFSAEGLHSLTASYSGNTTFVTSSGNANVFARNHATNTSTTYCNPGTISNNGTSNLGSSATTPYPSQIVVGDGVNTDLMSAVSTVSVRLTNFSSAGSTDLHMLLVAPDGTHAFDFWSNAGADGGNGSGSFTIADGSTQLPCQSTLSAGTFGPTTCTAPPDPFTPAGPAPSPQPPSSFVYAPIAGSSSFLSSFNGALAHGAWSLYFWGGTGQGVTSAATGGWCLDITPASGHPTTVTVTSAPTQAPLGTSVTFTATVTSSTTPNEGTVTFTENGSPLTGAPNNGVANVVNGVASISTSSLPEGDHTVSALYHDFTNTFNDNFGTVTMRVDKATGTPTLSTSTWTYCNTGAVAIPAGNLTINDIGPAQPNPSNIFVTNLPGTIESVNVTLKGLHLPEGGNILESLLVGPNGISAPTSAQTFDFFSSVGNNTPFAAQDTTFEDLVSTLTCNTTSSTPPTTDGPTSCGSTSYTASAFYTLPSLIQHATPNGVFTFNQSANHGVYQGTNPNGTWSLYFNQTLHTPGGGLTGGWCMNFTQNPVALGAVKGHIGSSSNNHFSQGEQGAKYTIDITNNGPGSTGDPDGLHPLTVVDVLAADFTPVNLPTGTPWSCGAVSQTVTCKSHNVVAEGANYPTLTIPVNVSTFAGSTDNNQVSISGGGATALNSNVDTVIIGLAPVLSISKAPVGTFTQGSTAEWDLTVGNTAPSSNTGGTTNVSDALPAGYTLASYSGTGWSCSGTTALSCMSSQVVTGGGDFNTLKLTVNVPANSPVSVTNNASAWGGGDLTHSSSGTAATTFSTVTVVQAPSTITINGSQTQSTGVNTAFGSLAVTVKDGAGAVIPNYSSVVFTATPGGGGQSGTFSNNTGTTSISTNGSGIANPGTFTASGIAGAYSVGVKAGSATATFNLTNTSATATVTNVTSTTANGSYTVNANIGVTVAFSKAVTVTGTPLLSLNSGGTASYTGGSGTSTLSFLYVVAGGQNSPHLDYTSTSALSLNGGAIQDASSTAAILTLPAPGSAGSLSANTNIVIDTVAPTVVSYSVDFGSTSFSLIGASRTAHLPWSVAGITVTFSKPIATASAASLGGISATGLSGVGTSTLTWTFGAITNATLSTTLAGSGANAIKDAAGNALSGGAGFAEAFSVLYGDFTGDGVVNASDMLAVAAATKQPYNLFADVNGDGVINTTDATIVKGLNGATQH